MKKLLSAVPIAFLLGALLGALEGMGMFVFLDLGFQQPAIEMLGMEWRYGLLCVLALPLAMLVAKILRLPFKAPAHLAGWSFLGLGWVVLNWWVQGEVLSNISIFSGLSFSILLGSVALVFVIHWLFRKATAASAKNAVSTIIAGIVLLPLIAQVGFERSTSPIKAAASANDLPDITVVVIDTLRADHLGLYGYAREDGERTSPFLDSLADKGMVFESCWSQAPWTRPSMASLHSGLYCSGHTVNETFNTLPEDVTSMAEMAHAQGYRTGGFSANANVSGTYGFDQGFEELWTVGIQRSLVSFARWGEFKHFLFNKVLHKGIWDGFDHAAVVNEQTFAWLDSVASDSRPKFTYVHYIDPHSPYEPPEGGFLFAGEPEDLTVLDEDREMRHAAEEYPFGVFSDPGQKSIDMVIRAYDSEIRYVDSEFEKLFAKLKSMGQLDENDWLIITSDHGEEFYDRGHWGHGQSLFEEQIHVPLIVLGPGVRRGARQKQEVNLLDVHTTLADITGFSPRPMSPGISLLPLVDGEMHLDDANTRILYSERLQGNKYIYAVRQANQKLIRSPDFEARAKDEGSEETLDLWFDLNSNPHEDLGFDFRTMIGGETLLPRDLPALQENQDLSALMDYARLPENALKGAVKEALANQSPADIKHLQELGYLDEDGNTTLGGH